MKTSSKEERDAALNIINHERIEEEASKLAYAGTFVEFSFFFE